MAQWLCTVFYSLAFGPGSTVGKYMGPVSCTPKEEAAQARGGVGSTKHSVKVTVSVSCLGGLQVTQRLSRFCLQGGSPHCPLDCELPEGRACAFVAGAKEPGSVPAPEAQMVGQINVCVFGKALKVIQLRFLVSF